MTPTSEAFIRGFLQNCADNGLTADQSAELALKCAEFIEKQATGFPEVLWNNPVTNAAGSALGQAGKYSLPLLLLAPPTIGAAAGVGLAKATDTNDENVKTLKKQELIDELRRQRLILLDHQRQSQLSAA